MIGTPQTREIVALVERIKPLLAGKSPGTQSAVLADLLATWVAGHFVKDDKKATNDLRIELLQDHLTLVINLIAVNAKAMGTAP